MKKKIKKLEIENEVLKKDIKGKRVKLFAIGAALGALLTLLGKNLKKVELFPKIHAIIKKKTMKLNKESELGLDEETLEVLKEEKDSFE
ncbi:MAG: hypothetical protein JEZ08_11905 [Clostridiales bacterium]|nr:hypothetical protein [Clostridiales bacterium]